MTAKIIQFGRQEKKMQERGRPPSVRAAAIEAAIRARPMMKRASERLLVGENMWRILQRLEDSVGVSKSAVLREARLGRPEESTKRLPLYAVKVGLDEATRAERGKKLTQHAEKYKKLIEGAGKLSGIPEDELIAELFAGTSYEDGVPEFPDHVLDLKDKLDRMVRWVVGEAELATYWNLIVGTRGSYDIDAGAIRPSSKQLSTLGEIAGGWIEHVDDLPPIPKVGLSAFPDSREVKGMLRVHKDGNWEDRGEFKISMTRILSLAIVPVEGVPRAAFEVRTEVVVKDSGGVEVAKCRDTDGTDGTLTVAEGNGVFRAELDYGPGMVVTPFPHVVPEPFGKYVDGADPWWALYVPVTPSTVKDYCSKPAEFLGGTGRLFPLPDVCWETYWPMGSLGEAIEANLLYAKDRLDDRLLDDAMAKNDLLQSFKAEAAQRQAEAEAELEAKWEVKGE